MPSKEYIRLGESVIAIESPSVITSVGVTPGTATVSAGGTQQFQATVAGSGDLSVTWSVTGIGTVSASGLYTAPSSVSNSQTVTVKATSNGDSSKSGTATLTIEGPESSPGCSSTWTYVALSNGSGSCASGVTTVQNQGGQLGGTSDSLEFAYVPLVGDGTIVARMTGFVAQSNAEAGVMLRTGPRGSAAMMFTGIRNGAGIVNWRTDTGATEPSFVPAAGTIGAAIGTPYWFKLVRSGSTISAWISANGVDWSQMGSTQTLNIAAGSTMYAGLAISGWYPFAPSTAYFDSVVVSSAADFYLTALPTVWTASGAGVTNSYAVGVGATNGFSGAVSLAVSGLPSNVQIAVNPASVTGSGSAGLTIATPAGMSGSYPFRVTATSGALTHAVNATLSVAGGTSGALPDGWLNSGINNNYGTTVYGDGVFSLQSQLGSLVGTWDSLQFAWTPMVGDGSITARMQNFWSTTNSEAGVMVRTGPTPTSGMLFSGIDNGAAEAKWRTATSLSDQSTTGAAMAPPFWFRITRAGNALTGYSSPNGVDWSQLGSSQTITDGGSTMYAGLALSGAYCCYATTVAFDNVTVTQSNGGSTPDFSLAAPTATQIVDAGESISMPVTVNVTGQFNGPVALSVAPATLPAGMTASFGPATVNGTGESTLILTAGPVTTGTFTLTVNGVSGSLSHSTTVTVTIDAAATPPVALSATTPASGTGGTFSFAASDPGGNGANISWMEVLVNGTLSGSQACYLHYDQTGQVLYLRDDTNPSWVASATMPIASGTSLVNGQCTVTGATATVAGGTLTLNATLAFTNSFAGTQTIYEIADSGNLNSGWDTVGSYTVTAATGSLPTGWNAADINPVGSAPSSASYSGGVYSVQNQAGQLGGTADSLEFAYVPLTGDGGIIARMTGFAAQSSNTDAGVMLRTGPTQTAAMMFLGMENGHLTVISRRDTGQYAQKYTGAAISLPYWLQLARTTSGGVVSVSALASPDSLTWTQVGSTQTLTAGTTIDAGLSVSGWYCCAPSSATFDGVQTGAPTFIVTGPSGSAQVLSPASSTAQITVTPILGFGGAVTLSADPASLPAGASASFSPASVTGPGTSTMTLTLPSGVSGNVTVTVIGTAGSISRSTSASYNVELGGAAAFAAYRTITIDHTKVGTVNQTDQTAFPVAISGTYSYLATAAHGGKVQSASGYDIFFTSDSAGLNLLNWELEKYDATTGSIAAWLKIPTLSHSADTVVYMFYGNAGVLHSHAGSTAAVWDQNFAAVWHMGNGTTISGADSTSNGNNGSVNGAAATTGEIGGGASFSGNQAIGVSRNSSIQPAHFTLSFWFKRSSAGVNWSRILSKGTDANGVPYGSWGAAFSSTDGTNMYFYLGFSDSSTDGWSTGTGVIAANTWYHMTLTYDGSMVNAYMNGALQYSHANTKALFYDTTALAIGASYNGGGGFQEYFSGTIDEVRLSSAARSADWIATEYNNQNSPGTFYAMGSEMTP